MEDLPYAMRALIRVPHRDRKGEVVPLNLLPAQRKFHALNEDIRCLQAALQLEVGTPDWKKASQGTGLRLKPKFRDRFKQIKKHGATKFIREAAIGGARIVDGPVRIVAGKCRRGGISAYCAARMILEANHSPAFRGIVMAHKGPNAELIFDYHRWFHARWPTEYDWFRMPTDGESRGRYEWANGSRIRVQTAGGDNSGRSDQHDVYHFSEAAFYPDYGEVRATLAARPKHAWVWEESTANGPSGGYYERWMSGLDFETVLEAYTNEDPGPLARWNGYFQFFFSWLEEPEYVAKVYDWERDSIVASMSNTEKKLVEAFGASVGQIKWRRDKVKEFGEDAGKRGMPPEQWFAQEYPATADEMFQSTGRTVFDAEILDNLKKEAKMLAPSHMVYSGDLSPVIANKWHANTTFWAQPKVGHSYTIGADIAKGLSHGDWTVLFVLDRGDGTRTREAALWRDRLEPERAADVIAALGELFNGAFVTIEMEGSAYATARRLVQDLKYPHVFKRVQIDELKDNEADHATKFGWLPTRANKSHAVFSLQSALTDGSVKIFSERVLHELGIYQNVEGKLGAPSKEHDDCVTAAFLAYFGHKVGAPPINSRALAAAEKRSSMDPETRAVWEEMKKRYVTRWKKERHLKAHRDSIPREWSF